METKRGSNLPDNASAPDFDAIYAQYGERILNLAYRLTANQETARDLTQDIFMKVYQNLGDFEKKSSVYTWIYRIALNHIYNYLKKERRQSWFGLLDKDFSDLARDSSEESVLPAGTHATAADRALEAEERARLVWDTIRTLPVKYRVPLVLHHYEEMSYKDIAAAMGLSMSAVETRIHRARKQLIKKLEPWLKHI